MSDPWDLNRFAVGGSTPSSDLLPPDPAGAPLRVGSPPLVWLLAALVLAVTGAALALLVVRDGPATLVPWLLAGPFAIALLGVFSVMDTRRRAMPVYAAAAWAGPLSVVVVVVILAAVTVSAIGIAFWIGRL